MIGQMKDLIFTVLNKQSPWCRDISGKLTIRAGFAVLGTPAE
jgi:hypothetical protein